MFCALCQGLFYLDKFREAAVLCVCVHVLEWALINMDEYTSRRLWKPTCPIMFKDIPFITWSPGTLSYQEMTSSISVD